jgi:flavin reductase (DIM6/NTAB) family NADH-FMN oxidoreductase RutF
MTNPLEMLMLSVTIGCSGMLKIRYAIEELTQVTIVAAVIFTQHLHLTSHVLLFLPGMSLGGSGRFNGLKTSTQSGQVQSLRLEETLAPLHCVKKRLTGRGRGVRRH